MLLAHTVRALVAINYIAFGDSDSDADFNAQTYLRRPEILPAPFQRLKRSARQLMARRQTAIAHLAGPDKAADACPFGIPRGQD
jgi:hypothetical protein